MLLSKAKKLSTFNIAKKFVDNSRLPQVNKFFEFKGKGPSILEKVRLKNEIKHYSPLEEKFRYKQIKNYYDINQKRKHGYTNKYFQELSDLLYENGKNYYEERLKLFNSIIQKKKRKNYTNLNFRNKFGFNSTFLTLSSGQNSKIKNYKKSPSFLVNSYKNSSQKNYNSDRQMNSTIHNMKNKTLYRNDESFYLQKNKIKTNDVLMEKQISQLNFDIFENDDVDIKEQYLSDRNDYKYRKELKELYHFYDNQNIKEMKYDYEKDLRNKMFKCDNDKKIINLKTNEPYKKEFFHKFKRLGRNYFSPLKLNDNKLVFNNKDRINRPKNKIKNEECMKVYRIIQKNLKDEKK